MKSLIVISSDNIGSESVQTVNARDLHSFLEVRQDFSNWIKKQIDRARLIENRDFVKLAQKGDRQILVEYHLTIDAGKQIGMMSGTDKGFEIRDYFLACEKQVMQLPSDPFLAQMELVKTVYLNQLELKKQIEGQQDQLSNVNSRVDALTPRLLASTITKLLGAVSHAAKVFRLAQGVKHIHLNVNESTSHFHIMLLDKFGVDDISYIGDSGKAFKLLRTETAKYQAEYDAWDNERRLFPK
jgi:phage anti-repressor protein